MRPCIARCLYAAVFTVSSIVLSAPGFASPVNFKLLPLVPPNAEIAAGFLNVHDPGATGRLLLTTHNNRLDLGDWIALTAVDTQLVLNEVIEVASAGPDGKLSEHLLLVAGHIDRDRIFRAAEQNGAEKTGYLAQTALVIRPFSREQGEMVDTRWLVILNDQIGIFGTQAIVQQALQRYDNHSLPDPELAERLARLHSDVTTWNVLAPGPKPKKDIFFAQSRGAWTHLLEDTDLVMVAAHFAHNIRVDFLIHAQNQGQSPYFADKTGFLREAFAPEPADQQEIAKSDQPRMQELRIDQDCVRASVLLSRRQFDEWRDREIKRNQAYFHPVLRTHGD